MRKLNKISLLTLTLVLAFSISALAVDMPDMGKPLVLKKEILSTSDPITQELISSGEFDTMEIIADNGERDGDFAGLEWITKSTYAQRGTQTKYQTLALWFRIGDQYGWVEGKDYRTEAKPGETIYERLTINKESFIQSFMSSGKSRAEVEALINSEEYLYTGALLAIYNDYNLNGEMEKNELVDGNAMFMEENKISFMATEYFGGNAVVIADWESRFQKIKLNATPTPDFFSTPEGEPEWKEEFATSAKTYTGQAGDTITIPITLHNIGSKAITDFACTWYGSGWENPYWKEVDLELEKGETKDFNIDVVVPDFGKPTKLVFRANVDGKTPATEKNLDNNITVITIQPDGIDLALLMTDDIHLTLKPGESYTFDLSMMVIRKDFVDMPVDAELTYNITNVNLNKTENFTINMHDYKDYPFRFTVYPNNTYVITGEVKSLNTQDVDLSNNSGKAIIRVNQTNDAYKENIDDDTRVNLVG